MEHRPYTVHCRTPRGTPSVHTSVHCRTPVVHRPVPTTLRTPVVHRPVPTTNPPYTGRTLPYTPYFRTLCTNPWYTKAWPPELVGLHGADTDRPPTAYTTPYTDSTALRTPALRALSSSIRGTTMAYTGRGTTAEYTNRCSTAAVHQLLAA